jgi:hypothetical protein
MSTMSAIEVERIGVGPSDKGQVYEVVIDGQVRGCVKCGETRIFEVPPGIHTVKLALDLYSSPPVKVVVGMGKTSLICQTRKQRRFPFFAPRAPSTQILVREEVEALAAPLPARMPRVSPLDAPWLNEALLPEIFAGCANDAFLETERLAAD